MKEKVNLRLLSQRAAPTLDQKIVATPPPIFLRKLSHHLSAWFLRQKWDTISWLWKFQRPPIQNFGIKNKTKIWGRWYWNKVLFLNPKFRRGGLWSLQSDEIVSDFHLKTKRTDDGTVFSRILEMGLPQLSDPISVPPFGLTILSWLFLALKGNYLGFILCRTRNCSCLIIFKKRSSKKSCGNL